VLPPWDANTYWAARPAPTVRDAIAWWESVEELNPELLDYAISDDKLQHPCILRAASVVRNEWKVAKVDAKARRRFLDRLVTGTGKANDEVLALPLDEALRVFSRSKPNAEGGHGGADLKARKLDPARFRHGPDFRSCHWDGTDYTFTATQAACVKVLWDALENGTPDVGQQYILVEGAGADSQSLKDVFKKSPAWQKMILASKTRGSFRLAEPT
jgi:hypothetical protein